MLVHGYLGVDLAIVAKVLADDLADLEAFAAQVESYLEQVRRAAALGPRGRPPVSIGYATRNTAASPDSWCSSTWQ